MDTAAKGDEDGAGVAADPALAEPLPGGGWRVQGREVSLPARVRDASSTFASFVVAADAVRRLWSHPALRLVEPWPGRAMCSIAVVDYRDNDLGSYLEVAVAFLVREAGSRPLPGIDLVRPGAGAFIHRLPVTTSFSRDAGAGIWGYPKTVAAIEVREPAVGLRRGTLRIDGRHVLTLSGSSGGRLSFRDAALDSWTLSHGVLWKTSFTSSGEGVSFRPRGATLELGDHPIADELRSLGLPRRPLMSGAIRKMSASFLAPRAVRAGESVAAARA